MIEQKETKQLIAPIGTIAIWPGPLSTVPNNWKLCNGEYLLASRYSELLSVIQDYWGKYEGVGASQSFSLPDLRGMFIRGVNDERNDKFQDPDQHTRIRSQKGSNEVGSVTTDTLPLHIHQVGRSTSDKKSESQLGRTRFADFIHKDDITSHKTSGPTSTTNLGGTPRVSSESRAKNAYVNYIIRAE